MNKEEMIYFVLDMDGIKPRQQLYDIAVEYLDQKEKLGEFITKAGFCTYKGISILSLNKYIQKVEQDDNKKAVS